ncbi:hypothetical protein GWI33_015340 [Rhynchophorus ferrugineus]|uniref:Uncharacterized protein n=1 Tax=Rhynchophorus ferrugineus TaxID=354439 RepID=A0A834I3S4_RHYFE|nr:hypothetical protein GWI33_015340 [Rhynchophorus ferrugineus]
MTELDLNSLWKPQFAIFAFPRSVVSGGFRADLLTNSYDKRLVNANRQSKGTGGICVARDLQTLLFLSSGAMTGREQSTAPRRFDHRARTPSRTLPVPSSPAPRFVSDKVTNLGENF